jgi:3-methyl-2-oxobutanoate hydroxymethyltransferase
MSTQTKGPPKRVTIHTLKKMKAAGEKIAMVTAYDATMARLVDAAEVDVILVGDSVGMVAAGHDSTLPVTMDQMVYHCASVSRGLAKHGGRAHLVGDLPFQSYQASSVDAVKNAMRMVAEGGAEAVKLEGGADYCEVIARIVRAGVPVMGHIGLTPQSVHKMGGYVVQGKDAEKARRILEDAVALEAAGCYALVLECIPLEVAREVTARIGIPTIGIGAGVHCDGQVLVVNDLLGLNDDFQPKFVKRFAGLAGEIRGAVESYVAAVRAQTFPELAHSFRFSGEWDASVLGPRPKNLRLVHPTGTDDDYGAPV